MWWVSIYLSIYIYIYEKKCRLSKKSLAPLSMGWRHFLAIISIYIREKVSPQYDFGFQIARYGVGDTFSIRASDIIWVSDCLIWGQATLFGNYIYIYMRKSVASVRNISFRGRWGGRHFLAIISIYIGKSVTSVRSRRLAVVDMEVGDTIWQLFISNI